MNELKKLVLFCFVLCLTVGTASAETLIWSDEFSGSSVDTSVWSYDVGGGVWGNQELMSYTDGGNISVGGGSLNIEARSERVQAQRFTSARINTLDTVMFQYGRIEVRLQIPDLGDGLWPAVWMMGTNGLTWPANGELDIMEMGSAEAIAGGVVNRMSSSAAHWEHNGGYAGYGLSYTASSDLNTGYHIWSMDWTPTMITTSMDGVEFYAIDISGGAGADLEEFHQPFYVLINLAVGGTFTGITSWSQITAPLPANMLVDYVRLYDNGYTTNVTLPGYCGDGTCGSGEDECNCATDCGTPPATETNCDDGIDEDCDGAADCDDPTGDCDSDPACQAGPCDNDGICDPGEDCDSCPNDCDSVIGGRPSNRYCCGNGVVEGPEGDGRCDGNP